MSVDAHKNKNSLPRPRGCLLPLIPIILLAACYGSIWLFAWYGGEWSMSDQIPVPPESQPIGVIYSASDVFMMKHAFYGHDWSAETLRDWFVEQGVSIQDQYSTDGYYEIATHYTVTREINTFPRSLHRSAVQYLYSQLRWIRDGQAGCAGWTVVRDSQHISKVFQDLTLEVPADKTVFAIHTCWLNVRPG